MQVPRWSFNWCWVFNQKWSTAEIRDTPLAQSPPSWSPVIALSPELQTIFISGEKNREWDTEGDRQREREGGKEGAEREKILILATSSRGSADPLLWSTHTHTNAFRNHSAQEHSTTNLIKPTIREQGRRAPKPIPQLSSQPIIIRAAFVPKSQWKRPPTNIHSLRK